jgi:hypothetical protein
MKRILLNDAFHRLIGSNWSAERAERAWLTLVNALKSGVLKLWCNGTLLALSYVVNHLHIDIRGGNLEVLPAGIGWDPPPGARIFDPLGLVPRFYVFEIDREEFERLPAMSPDRPYLKRAVLEEAQRLDKEDREVNAGVLFRWLENSFKNQKVILPTPRAIRSWLVDWRIEGKLKAAPIKQQRKRRK